jgi:tetratricopeptide (TPR) repeat protein/CHAT domain-containing protein
MTSNPADVLWQGLFAVVQNQLSIEQYLTMAANPALALLATTESVVQLVARLAQVRGQSGQAALLFADAVQRHAYTLVHLRHPHVAAMLYQAAWPIFEEHAPPEMVAEFFYCESFVWRNLYRFEEAIACLDRAADILQNLVDGGRGELPFDLVKALMNMGVALARQGKLAEAIDAYDRAIDLLKKLVAGGRSELANDLALALMHKGYVLQSQGKLAEAIAAYEKSIDIREKLVDGGRSELANDLAMVLSNKGNALQSQGKLAEAIAVHDRAVNLLTKLVDGGRSELADNLASALVNKGNVLQSQGQLTEAIAACNLAIDLLKKLVAGGRSELANDLALALMNKGNALQSQGKLAEAIAVHDRAIDFLQKLVDGGRSELANDLASALMNKGNVLQSQGQLTGAIAAYDLAISIRQKLVAGGRGELANNLALALMNKGTVLQSQGKLAEAIAAYDQAIDILRKLVDSGRHELANDLAMALGNKAQALGQQGNLPDAITIYQRHLSLNMFSGDDRLKYHASFADLLWRDGQHEQALEHLTRGRAVLRQSRRTAGIDETTLEYVAQREGFIDQTVRCTLAMNRHADAFASVQDGKATVLGDLRSRLGSSAAEPDAVHDARRLLTAWLQQPPQRTEGMTDTEAEQLGTTWRTELTQRTDVYLRAWRHARHDPVTTRPDGPALADEENPLPSIQAALQPGWAILDFWRLDDDTITVFAVTRDELVPHTLSFPLAKLHRKLERLFAAIANPLGTAHNDEVLNDLHAYLFAPLLPWLRERHIRGLYLVPHGFLHALPLHAAREGSSDYLGDEFDVACLPSASLLTQLKPLNMHGPVFSLANPERGTKSTLPFADWEGEQVRQQYASRGGAFHRGPDARFDRTLDWGEAALLHFSCHGSGHAGFAPLAHLRLADDLLLAHDVMYRRPPLREGALVTLNGCQTAVRDVRAHNESMGLMTAFLLRGASLVLATQWSVEDRCAAEMVLSFLDDTLNSATPPTQALRLAQRKARAMTPDDLLQRWESVEKGLPDDSPEKAKLLLHRAWLCHQAGRSAEARHYAELAGPALRHAGLARECDQALAAIRNDSAPPARRDNYDHPVFWAAFQLVGRVV